MAEPKAWEPRAVLRERMKTIRKHQGLTQEGLADKLTEQGSPIDRASLGKIETGSRGISLDEAVAIALALDVSIAHLLVPDSPVPIQIGKWRIAGGGRYAQWVRGGRPLPSQDDRSFEREIPPGAWDVDPVGADAMRVAMRQLQKLADESEERERERQEQNRRFLEYALARGLLKTIEEEGE